MRGHRACRPAQDIRLASACRAFAVGPRCQGREGRGARDWLSLCMEAQPSAGPTPTPPPACSSRQEAQGEPGPLERPPSRGPSESELGRKKGTCGEGLCPSMALGRASHSRSLTWPQTASLSRSLPLSLAGLPPPFALPLGLSLIPLAPPVTGPSPLVWLDPPPWPFLLPRFPSRSLSSTAATQCPLLPSPPPPTPSGLSCRLNPKHREPRAFARGGQSSLRPSSEVAAHTSQRGLGATVPAHLTRGVLGVEGTATDAQSMSGLALVCGMPEWAAWTSSAGE